MRRLALSLLLAAAPLRADSASEWFAPFRGLDAFTVEDSSWLAKDPANVEGPALLKVRHILVLFKAEGIEPRLWPRRNLLLIEMPSGGRWVTELGEGELERKGSDARPWTRISNGRAVLEAWLSGVESEKGGGPEEPCSGSRVVVRGGGREVEFFAADNATKSLKAELKELREAALADDERRELEMIKRLKIPDDDAPPRLLSPETAWDLAAVPSGQLKPVVLVPDPEPDPDLDRWHAVTWIPTPLSPMDVPEGL